MGTFTGMNGSRWRRPAAALLCVALLTSACSTSAIDGKPVTSLVGKASPDKPNIVFVLTDDMSLNLISHMPNVQALRKAGTTMSKYYVVDSLCCPSRTAIFTGQYAHNNGVFTNGGSDGGYATYNRKGNQQKAFAVPLHAAGYRTGFMGKYLNGYEPTNPAPAGWDDWAVTGNGYKEFNYTLNDNGTQRRYGHAAGDYLTDVVSKKGGQFIDSAASNKQPFMLEIATFAPHGPYTPAPRYANSDTDVTYPRTPGYDKIPTDPPAWLADRKPLKAKQQNRIDDAFRQRVRADRAVDDLLKHLQDRLKANGVAGNTYFVFSSDNGYHMGENRLMPGKQTAFDTDINVPLVVSGPGVPAGRTVDKLATNIDLAPTFLNLTATPHSKRADGVSLASLWHGHQPADWQDAVLVEHHGPNTAADDPDKATTTTGKPPTYAAVRTKDALYVRYGNGAQEYYDTSRDPYQLHNIAKQGVPPQLPKTLSALQNCKGATQCQAAARL